MFPTKKMSFLVVDPKSPSALSPRSKIRKHHFQTKYRCGPDEKYMKICKLSRCYNFDDNSTQSLIRTYLNPSQAKTQGSLYVRIKKQILWY